MSTQKPEIDYDQAKLIGENILVETGILKRAEDNKSFYFSDELMKMLHSIMTNPFDHMKYAVEIIRVHNLCPDATEYFLTAVAEMNLFAQWKKVEFNNTYSKEEIDYTIATYTAMLEQFDEEVKGDN